MKKAKISPRLWVQLGFTALTNGYINGFIQGKIYSGPGKQLCVPGLNCYSCPGALGACPIGSLQAVLSSRDYRFSFYVIGFLMAVGALCGRLICGFLCPFGLVQDLLYKIPSRKLKKLSGEKHLRYLKYVVLVVFVIWLPLTVVNIVGQGDPWFCKWICPSGTLMGGLPLLSLDPLLRRAAGWLFGWKLFVLAALLALSVFYYRPFCKFLCPLGAVYGLFNPISLYRYRMDAHKCVGCGGCAKSCKLGLDPRAKPNQPDCIRCGECLRACPTEALSVHSLLRNAKAAADSPSTKNEDRNCENE